MRLVAWVCCLAFIMQGCSVKYDTLHVNDTSSLSAQLVRLGRDVDPNEASHLAGEAFVYSKILAKRYGLVSPPTFHNFLINAGFKERGLCYEWSEDLMAHLKAQGYKSFDLRWGVANKGELDEHNSVVVVAKKKPFESGILLDPWRNSGELYWTAITNDSTYIWHEDLKRSRYFGTMGLFGQ